MDITIFAVIGLALAVIGVIMWAFRQGGKITEARIEKGRADAAEEQLEMGREADRIERDVDRLTEDELDAELGKWSRRR